MGACFAVALLAADQVTTFDVAAHGCNVPTQRSRQSAQAQKRSLGKRLSHWLWNLGAHLLPGMPLSRLTGRARRTACHDTRIEQKGRITRCATYLLPIWLQSELRWRQPSEIDGIDGPSASKVVQVASGSLKSDQAAVARRA